MKKGPVVLISVNGSENLGTGYLAAVLSEAGFESKVITLQKGKPAILRILKKLNPILVGFSIIIYDYIDQFIDLIACLRSEDINCHFTAGGHYASLKYEELFKIIPLLDSVVRFEGEYTLLELVRSLSNGEAWEKTDGIAYMKNNKLIINRLRPPVKDLDQFPFPARSSLKKFAFNEVAAPILSGRGCIHRCSFCNTREFYARAKAPVKRLRDPLKVVSEIEYLYKEKGCSIFLFDDDDFPLMSKQHPEWVLMFCNELREKKLKNKIIWKINCRPDEVELAAFSMMKEYGLFHVFLGIEDGTDIGLKKLNKQMSADSSIDSINILRKLRIGFDYGFMLFQPDTTFKSLYDNVGFLRQICCDGYTSATFLKLLPFYETSIEKDLLKERRLKGSPGKYDYEFREESMNHFYKFVSETFNEWLGAADGMENITKCARNHVEVYKKFFYIHPLVTKHFKEIRRTVADSNKFLLEYGYGIGRNF